MNERKQCLYSFLLCMTSRGNQNEGYGFPQLGSSEPGEKPELSANILSPLQFVLLLPLSLGRAWYCSLLLISHPPSSYFIYFFCFGCLGLCCSCPVACGIHLSSLIRDRTHVPCIARGVLNHWTTRKVPSLLFNGFQMPPRLFEPCHLPVLKLFSLRELPTLVC